MNQIISQYGTEVEMVISNNDEMALGAIEAYKDAGYNRQEWPIIFGIDGLEDALEAIQNGTMQGTVYNDKEGLQWIFTMEKIRKYKACRKKNIMYPSIVKLTSVMLKIL